MSKKMSNFKLVKECGVCGRKAEYSCSFKQDDVIDIDVYACECGNIVCNAKPLGEYKNLSKYEEFLKISNELITEIPNMVTNIIKSELNI